MLDTTTRTIFEEEHEQFRDAVRKFFAAEMLPYCARWDEAGIVDREFWLKAGAAGLLCPSVDPEYGGLGLDFRYNSVVGEEVAYSGATPSLRLHSDIVVPYLEKYGNEEQKARYLPKMVSGELIVAIGMSEPGAGSDLKAITTSAVRDGDDYIINGSKTYITNGQLCDLVIVVAKTQPELGAKGVSLILVEADRAGFTKGRKLDKIGQRSADTSELFFEDVRVPVSNRLGEEGRGFIYLMSQLPQERLSIAVAAQAQAQRCFDEAVAYTKQRKAFGSTVFDFQNTRFTLAGLKAELQGGWAHLDWCIARLVAGTLTNEQASAAKLLHTEMQWKVADAAMQMHGGAGYINDYAIARLWKDARITRIWGGSNEIMKEIIGRTL
jgi:alkylation response protein AidB-like acyl-CoA dehydrogenase